MSFGEGVGVFLADFSYVSFLKESERLVAERTTEAYRKVSELRGALADSKHAGLAEKQARKLKKNNPTLRRLAGALRREGLLAK